jgi:twitching motility protein PilJ
MGTVGRGGGGGAAAGAFASMLVLVVSAAVFAANFVYLDYLSGRDDNALAATAELQVGSQQLAKYAQLAVAGDADAYDAFAAVHRRIDVLVQGLESGSTELGVHGYQGGMNEIAVAAALADVSRTWRKMAMDADRVEQGRERVLDSVETATRFQVRIPQISAQLAEVVRGMSDSGSAASQINLANRQIVLADRMSRRVAEMLAGGDVAVTAADALQRDAHVFDQVLRGLREGAPEAGIARVTNAPAVAALDKVAELHGESLREVERLLQASTELAEIQVSTRALAEDSDVLLLEANELFGAFGSPVRRLFPNALVGLLAGAIAAFALLALAVSVLQMRRELLRRP